MRVAHAPELPARSQGWFERVLPGHDKPREEAKSHGPLGIDVTSLHRYCMTEAMAMPKVLTSVTAVVPIEPMVEFRLGYCVRVRVRRDKRSPPVPWPAYA